MSTECAVFGTNDKAPFSLKVHRGDGMCLLAMDWKNGKPPMNFVGFSIESREPGAGKEFVPVQNRLRFDKPPASDKSTTVSSLLSPFQYFRWVHFPYRPELTGAFAYRVQAVFMDAHDKLTYSPAQEVDIVLGSETYPGKLNIAYTRGYISSQRFMEKYGSTQAELDTILPPENKDPLTFTGTHKKIPEAYEWMGLEARAVVLGILDDAIADTTAQVRAVVYDLNSPEVVERFEKLGGRLRIIIDDSTSKDKKTGKLSGHGLPDSSESTAAERLRKTGAQVKRQHMGSLQHNKTIAVDGKVQRVLLGSTNLTWRGLYVQNNHAVTAQGATAVKCAFDAFDAYWKYDGFSKAPVTKWRSLGLKDLDAQVAFSPRAKADAIIPAIAADFGKAKSSLFYSLAFLAITPGKVRETIKKIQDDDKVFSFGIADSDVAALKLTKPSGLVRLVHPEALGIKPQWPFKPELKGGKGARLHHKFMVVDFDEPTARVYFGSFNFSSSADTSNGENLTLIRDQRAATSFMIEAVRIFDHYSYRLAVTASKKTGDPLLLKRPPAAGEKPWWDKFYKDPFRIQDRVLFSRVVPGALPVTNTPTTSKAQKSKTTKRSTTKAKAGAKAPKKIAKKKK